MEYNINIEYNTIKEPEYDYYSGWISLHRKFMKWEWYNNPNIMRLFLHLLLSANHQNNRWQGIDIYRGQVVTSVKNLSKNLNLTEMQIRNSLNKLKTTNEITIKTTNKYTIITILKYDIYQIQNLENNKQNNKRNNKQITNKQQTNNNQTTTNNKDNKDNKVNKENNINSEFEFFRKNFPGKKLGYEIEFTNFKKKNKDWEEVIPLLMPALNKEISYRDLKEAKGEFVAQWKNLQTWINKKCWLQEFEIIRDAAKPVEKPINPIIKQLEELPEGSVIYAYNQFFTKKGNILKAEYGLDVPIKDYDLKTLDIRSEL